MLKYKEPKFVRLPKNKLKVNTDFYQKPYVQSRVLNLAKKWDDEAVGTLIVVHDKNDDYWVVDGQHRLLAAQTISRIRTMPCMVVDSNDVEHDARLYRMINTEHKKPDARHLFKVAYELKEEPEYSIGNMLEEYGFIWRSHNSKTSQKPVATCVNSIIKVHDEYGPEITREAIGILSLVYQNNVSRKPVSSDLLYGISYLLKNGNIPDHDKFMKAISECSPTFLRSCCDDAVLSDPTSHTRKWSSLARGIQSAVNSKISGRNKVQYMITMNVNEVTA